MRRLPPHLAPLGYSPTRYNPLSPAPVNGMGERLTDMQAIQRLFANGENGGYWPADPQYLFEDSAGTIPASVNGVVGLWANNVPGKPSAIQATTANKPYLRRTPVSGKTWLDSNTATGALNVTFPSVLGVRNIVNYSQAFSSWTQWRCSTVENTTLAPNGLMAADTVTVNTETNSHGIGSQSIAITIGTVYTISVYAKAGTASYLQLTYGSTTFSTNTYANFDLSTGALGTVGSDATATISAVGDGWYRCTMTATATATNNINAYIYFIPSLSSPRLSSFTGNGTDSVILFGAQCEVNSVATEYQYRLLTAASVLDVNALTDTWQKNISATTNCTIACATAEGVVIADNQTVGTTYNITPPYGYNGDVLIINRALTASEKALVARVLGRGVPTLGSELVTNGAFETDDWWTKGANVTIANGVASVAGAGNSYIVYKYNFTAIGTTYYCGFTVSNYAAGRAHIYTINSTVAGLAANGTIKRTFTATNTLFSVAGTASPVTLDIDNVSLKAIL